MTPTPIAVYPPTSAFLHFHNPPLNPPALRLSLSPALCRLGTVDGVWWPYSNDAGEELPALVAELDRRLDTAITRIGVHPDAWSHVPRLMTARGRVIEVGWFHSTSVRLISLHAARGDYDLKLLVISPGSAEAAMTDHASTIGDNC